MITVTFKDGSTTATVTDDVWQFDYGQKLQIEGLSLPEEVGVDFSFGNNASYESVTEEGKTDGGVTIVNIPDDMLSTDKTKDYTVYAYIFEVTSEEEESDTGETTYVVTMPVKTRPKRP